MRLFPLVSALLLTASNAGPLMADDDDEHTRLQFETEASRQVNNDSMRATLFVEIEESTPARASSRATRTMNETLRKLQSDRELQARTGNLRTFPVNHNGSISGWRARSEVIIESSNFPAASAAIGSVAQSMQIARIEFFVSPALRETVEGELADEAIAAFRNKAGRIAESFGSKTFDVAQASVINRGGRTPVRPMMRSMAADAPATAPELSGGTTNMSVTVSGVILIER
jgi:predicted secreted protein